VAVQSQPLAMKTVLLITTTDPVARH